MAEPRDDRVSGAYRELPGTGPTPAIDAAIGAAARRAVGSRPGQGRRWQVPISIAAVLALAIGVSLQVEREKPMVVDGTPVSSGSAEYPVPQAEPDRQERGAAAKPAVATTPVAPPAAQEPAAAPRTQAVEKRAREAVPAMTGKATLARDAPVAPEAKRFAPDSPRAEPAAPAAASVPSSTPPPAPVARPASPAVPAAPAPPPASAPMASPEMAAARARDSAGAAAPPAAAGAVAPVEPARAAAQSAKRMKSEASADSATRESAPLPAARTPEQGLQRIVELRSLGLHDQADRALAELRRAFPDYRISEEWLRKVERR